MIGLEEAEKIASALTPIPTTHMGLYKINVSNAQVAILALCAENKKLRELVGAQKELINQFEEVAKEVNISTTPKRYYDMEKLRTKIAELEKKTDSTDNVLIGEDDQMGNYL